MAKPKATAPRSEQPIQFFTTPKTKEFLKANAKKRKVTMTKLINTVLRSFALSTEGVDLDQED